MAAALTLLSPRQSSWEGYRFPQLRKVKIRSWVLHLDCEDWRQGLKVGACDPASRPQGGYGLVSLPSTESQSFRRKL